MARRRAYVAFAAFGGFWGVWGASVPAIRDQAGVSEGQLGVALLFIGAGALPAMLLAGRAVDRYGDRAIAATVTLLGIAGAVVAFAARDLLSLAVALVVLGATSGAADVAINTAAGAAQRRSHGPVVARAHGTFSAAVVVASLATGGLLAAGLPVAAAFLAVASVMVFAAIVNLTGTRADAPAPAPREPVARAAQSFRLGPLLLIGGLGALAFAIENAHQSWSALYLRDEVGATSGVAAAGPAVFAGVVAATRFAMGEAGSRTPQAVLVGGAMVAGLGTALVAAADTLAVALAGLALAAAGTAVLFPTLIVVLSDRVPDHARGAATSRVTTVAYLGFLAGPPYVGVWADGVGLPGAMIAVAALTLALGLLAAVSVRRLPSGETAPSQ